METMKNDLDGVVLEKIAIMIDIMITMFKCSYSDAYAIISKSEVYRLMKEYNYAILHDSPQANLSMIGEELRLNNNPIGKVITNENIKRAMMIMREKNLKEQLNKE